MISSCHIILHSHSVPQNPILRPLAHSHPRTTQHSNLTHNLQPLYQNQQNHNTIYTVASRTLHSTIFSCYATI
jgi:hypothetical protein